jgi:hypothetical protein
VDMGEGTPQRVALACKLTVVDGMRILSVTPEIQYCLGSIQPE